MTENTNHQVFSEFENAKNEILKEDKPLKKENIFDRFSRERLEWTEKIENLSKKLYQINDMVELQVKIYSERQKAVEYYHYLMSLLASKNREYRQKYKERFEFYSYKYDLRVKDDIKATFIANDLKDIYAIKEALENHMKFIDKTITTLDNIIYGIKHRLMIEEYKLRL